jgi:hypothetical protein
LRRCGATIMALSDRLRHADNTLRKFREMTPKEQEMAERRLVKLRDELEGDRDDLSNDLDELYDNLTPTRAQKYPEKYGRKFSSFEQSLAEYEAVCNMLGHLDKVLSDRGVMDVKVGKEAHQADEEATRYEARPLLSVHR